MMAAYGAKNYLDKNSVSCICSKFSSSYYDVFVHYIYCYIYLEKLEYRDAKVVWTASDSRIDRENCL